MKHWSLRTLRNKLIKIGAKVVSHSRYVIFQMAEVAVPQTLFQAIFDRIRQLRFLTDFLALFLTTTLSSVFKILKFVKVTG